MPARVLAADDDEAWRDLLARWLASGGYDATVVSRGGDVLPAALKIRPQAVVLDYDMGDQTGAAVCAQLKAHPELKTAPVILLTSMSGKMLEIIAEQRPDHFVVKSEHPEELLFVLEGLMGRPS